MSITPSPSDVVQHHHREMTPNKAFERPLTITCPDCGGALKKIEIGSITKFGCHIGHTYTAETMATVQFEEMEKVLRAAVRVLNERAEFCLQMAERSELIDPKVSTDWHSASRQALDRAYRLRDIVEQDWITPQATGSPAALAPDQRARAELLVSKQVL